MLYDRGKPRETGIELAGRTAIRLHTDRHGGTTVKSQTDTRSEQGQVKNGVFFCPMPPISNRTLPSEHFNTASVSSFLKNNL